jgi:exodeoxyribonuclease V alpha subunit
MEAKTIHRMLGTRAEAYGFIYNENNQLDCDLLVVDEISMVDILMMNNLLKAVPKTSGLIMVGDVDQLPSVGPGSVLANIIDSEVIPTIRLTEIFRQAQTSQIIINAHKINQGNFPKLEYLADEPTDFYFVKEEDPEKVQQKLIEIVARRLPQAFNLNPLTDVQVLTPMNKGAIGARSLNVELKKHLNPTQGAQITKYGITFSVGDKVIQTINNYDKDVFNGDIGFIKSIDLEEGEVVISFDNKQATYDVDELDEITLAYAVTIHKSQGSEYPAIVIPLTTQHFPLLERNLLYTGVTRGKKLVVIIGQIKALGIAVKTKRASKRLTKLTERLNA